MTDYYTKMCDLIEAGNEDALLLANMIQTFDDLIDGETPLHELPTDVLEKVKALVGDDALRDGIVSTCVETEVDDDGITISSITVTLDALGKIINLWMNIVERETPVTLEFGYEASRDVVDAYGGGVLMVTRKGWNVVDTTGLAEAGLERKDDAIQGLQFVFNDMYARTMVPAYVDWIDYAGRTAEYTPWVVCNKDPDALCNENMDAHWKAFTDDGADEIDEFATYLEEHGYVILHTDPSGVWSPPV